MQQMLRQTGRQPLLQARQLILQPMRRPKMSNCLVPRAVILWTGPETLSTWKLWTTGPGASIAREADLCDYGGVRVVYFGMRVPRTLMHPRDEERETRSVTKTNLG